MLEKNARASDGYDPEHADADGSYGQGHDAGADAGRQARRDLEDEAGHFREAGEKTVNDVSGLAGQAGATISDGVSRAAAPVVNGVSGLVGTLKGFGDGLTGTEDSVAANGVFAKQGKSLEGEPVVAGHGLGNGNGLGAIREAGRAATGYDGPSVTNTETPDGTKIDISTPGAGTKTLPSVSDGQKPVGMGGSDTSGLAKRIEEGIHQMTENKKNPLYGSDNPALMGAKGAETTGPTAYGRPLIADAPSSGPASAPDDSYGLQA